MDLGTLSSWVAAGISFSSVAGAAAWTWWSRPVVAFIPSGDIRNPSQDRETLVLAGRIGNYGDGNAHRVSVWIWRSPDYEPQRISLAPLLRPGESVEFETSCSVRNLDKAVIFVTWTPAPLRHRNERRSPDMAVRKHLEMSSFVRDFLEKRSGGRD